MRAHSGANCVEWCGSVAGDGFSVAGNMLANRDVVPATAEVFATRTDLALPERLMAAMRHGVIMRRVTERSVLFGQAIRPPDADDMIIHRATLRAILDGTYVSMTSLTGLTSVTVASLNRLTGPGDALDVTATHVTPGSLTP